MDVLSELANPADGKYLKANKDNNGTYTVRDKQGRQLSFSMKNGNVVNAYIITVENGKTTTVKIDTNDNNIEWNRFFVFYIIGEINSFILE